MFHVEQSLRYAMTRVLDVEGPDDGREQEPKEMG